jgi:hypothetical protein
VGVLDRVTKRLVGMEGDSFSARARARRFQTLLGHFPSLGDMRVLDFGGEPHSWRNVPVRPREIVLLNLDWQVARTDYEIGDDASWMSVVAGNACAPPEAIRQDRFDLVFSNSVIEHVGGHEQRSEFARWARELGTHHWIQTPNRYFPIEPHWVFPGFQFLPARAQAHAMRHWPIGNDAGRDWTYDKALEIVRGVELVTASDMRGYFPDATIVRERLAGLTKSLVAVR